MSTSQDSVYEYQFGGSLQADALTYLERQADKDLYEGLKAGQFCYILNSRQMGKSSLRVRTMARLQAEGIACVAIQMTDIIEEEMNSEQWYAGVVNSIVMDLGLNQTFDDAEWWASYGYLSAVQRFSKFIREVLLKQFSGNIVIFIDEIDRILSLKFNLNGFFAVIRECYNKRADVPAYRRLTFTLIGVATPSNLIQDKRSTPFNIGRAIDLAGFQFKEALPLAQGLEGKTDNPQALLKAVLYWTGGQPFLTQKLCNLIVHKDNSIPPAEEEEWLGNLVNKQVIRNWEAQDEPEHLRTIRDRTLSAGARTGRLVKLYRQILEQGGIEAEGIPDHMELQLSGLVVKHVGRLRVANPIYESVFNKRWIDRVLANLQPYAEALEAWIASNYQDEAKLLRGQALEEALRWTISRTVSEQERSFLSISQELEQRETKAVIKEELQAIYQRAYVDSKKVIQNVLDYNNIQNQSHGTDANLFFNQQEFKNRNRILSNIQHEVFSRLKASLYNAVLIDLRLETLLSEVRKPWEIEVRIGNSSYLNLPIAISITEAFERPEIEGRLLILGSPGSGKTTALLNLAQNLIDRAIDDINYPIPVLLNLASWNDPRQPITDWLVAELKSKYGVRKDISKKWLQEKQLLPLLDGLDEVKFAYQESCVQALNQWLQSESRPQYLVVCSRREEYAGYETRLYLNGAILLQVLTDEQIQQYLADVNQADLWQVLQQDAALLQLVRTPLLLSITLLSKEEVSMAQWQQLTSTEKRGKLLMDAYVQRMLGRALESKAYRKRRFPTAKQTRYWLKFLARQLQRESQTEFLIENLQPEWLPHNLYILYKVIVGLVFALLSGGMAVITLGPLSGGFLGIIIGGVNLVMPSKIFPVESVRLAWVNGRVLVSLTIGLILGIMGGQTLLSLVNSLHALAPSWPRGLIPFLGEVLGIRTDILIPASSLIIGVSNGLLAGIIVSSDVENKAFPNQGIIKSGSNSLWLGLLSAGFSGIASGLLFGLSFGVTIGVVSGLISTLLFGGSACVEHFILRLVLYLKGYIPWNYARFLNYATEQLFLQRVGGRYRFIHILLQEHFTQLSP